MGVKRMTDRSDDGETEKKLTQGGFFKNDCGEDEEWVFIIVGWGFRSFGKGGRGEKGTSGPLLKMGSKTENFREIGGITKSSYNWGKW